MESLSKREIFNKAKEHMLKQNMKSSNGTTCLYRGPNGLKCGVGCLIDDEAYFPKIENQAVFVREVIIALKDSGIDELGALQDKKSKMYLLDRIQNIHDNFDVSEWQECLVSVEKELLEDVQ